MKIRKAVITAAGRGQRKLPLQTIIDEKSAERSVLGKIIEEATRAKVREIAVIVAPGDADAYAAVAESSDAEIRFIEQPDPRGYGDAILRARDFTGDEPFLHLVGDHIYVSDSEKSCTELVVEAALVQDCAVSAVQVTREHLLPYFGAVGGQPVAGSPGLYKVDTVIEKPTPTEAELRLQVSGLRASQYLCFFGVHVLTPTVMELLAAEADGDAGQKVTLAAALAALAPNEKYLALEISSARRFDIGHKYGLFIAQLAMALRGPDRDQVLARMFDVAASGSAGFLQLGERQ
jgi:UTP--glucose-1-phosphate uridylyltransferase